MKLYTEEQMLSFANWCRIHDSYNRNEVWMIGQLLTKFENTEPLSKPIELPTDDEIGQEFKYSSENWEVRQALEEGAKWMRDKIKGGNK